MAVIGLLTAMIVAKASSGVMINIVLDKAVNTITTSYRENKIGLSSAEAARLQTRGMICLRALTAHLPFILALTSLIAMDMDMNIFSIRDCLVWLS